MGEDYIFVGEDELFIKNVLARITYSAEITVFVNISLFSERLNCY